MKRNFIKATVLSIILALSFTSIVFAEELNVKIPEQKDMNYMLPGETVEINPTNIEKIKNNNSFDVIVELDFMANSKGFIGNPNYPYFEAFKFQSDYDCFSTLGKVAYLTRLSDVINLNMQVSNDWIYINNKYYTKIKAGEEKEVNQIMFELLPELGGGMRNATSNPYPAYSIARHWEQESYFELGYKLTFIEAKQDEIRKMFGQELIDTIDEKGLSTNWLN